MTSPLCGAAHHLYPDTLCTQPAGHYRRDRDPHGGPLIIDGRECGGAAWDEPQEQQMTDRHTVDTITSDALDALYAEQDRLTAELADYEQRAENFEGRAVAFERRHATLKRAHIALAEQAGRDQAALARVRAVHHRDGDTCTVCTTDFGRRHAPWPCPTMHALGEPVAHIGDGADTDDCPACNAEDADAHGIRTCPGPTTTEK